MIAWPRLVACRARVREFERRIKGLVADHPLRQLWGAGPLVTAKLIGETGDINRFRSADAFAMLAGVAPIPASSGQTNRMRLNRGGNRQINRALHGIALAQVRTYPPGKGVRGSEAGRGQGLVRGPTGSQAPPRPDRVPPAEPAAQSGSVFGGLTR